MFQGCDSKVMDDFINPGPELMAALIDAHGPPGHQINFPGNSYENSSCVVFNFLCTNVTQKKKKKKKKKKTIPAVHSKFVEWNIRTIRTKP